MSLRNVSLGLYRNVVLCHHVRNVSSLNQPIVLFELPSCSSYGWITKSKHCYWLIDRKYNTHVMSKDHISAIKQNKNILDNELCCISFKFPNHLFYISYAWSHQEISLNQPWIQTPTLLFVPKPWDCTNEAYQFDTCMVFRNPVLFPASIYQYIHCASVILERNDVKYFFFWCGQLGETSSGIFM